MAKELLFSVTKKDFVVQTFTSGGKGGQHQNRVETGVRIIHPPSGARGEARDSRSQHQNKEAAFRRLLDSREWKAWHKLECAKRLGQTAAAEDAVERSLAESNIVTEVATDKGWSKVDPHELSAEEA